MTSPSSIAVIIPALDEQRLISATLAGIPAYVAAVYVVDDASSDATFANARACGDPRVRVLRHSTNRGVGAAIVTGYAAALSDGHDVLAVMAADNQMDPDDLRCLVQPVIEGRADYVKGNRFVHERVRDMPSLRRWAGRWLSWVTRRVTRLEVDDCQCGFTALSARAAKLLPLHALWPRYGYPNDLLAMLAERSLRVAEVRVRPVYASERSGIRPWHALVVLALLWRAWLRRRRFRNARPRLASDPAHP